MKWLGVVVVLFACQSGVPMGGSKPPPSIANVAPPVPSAHRYAIGTTHACARTNKGRVACWGNNERGQIGDGTRADRYAPVVVPGLVDIEGVAASDESSCAWNTAGAVWCWGGNGVSEYTPAPVRMEMPPVTEVLAGGEGACALHRDRSVRCWYYAAWRGAAAVTEVSEVRGATQIAVGRYTVAALMPGGTVMHWRPTTAGTVDLTKEPTLTGVTKILADRGFSERFLVERDGAWLSMRMSKENTTAIIVPVPAGLAPVALDELHACGILGGSVSCITLNDETDAFGTPTVVENTAGAVDVRLSSTAPLSHPPIGCARFADDSLRCWGPASSIGAGERNTVERAIEIPGLDDVVELASFDDNLETLVHARRRSGRVVFWGMSGVVGEVPVRSPRDLGISDATALLPTDSSVCVARGAKKVTCYSQEPPVDIKYRFTAKSAPINGGWCDLDARGVATCTWPRDEHPTEQPEEDAHPVPKSAGRFRRIWPGSGAGCGERRSDGVLTCWFTDERRDTPTSNQRIVGTFQTAVVDAATMPNYTVHSDHDFCFVRPDGHVGCISTMAFDRFDLVPGVTDAVEIATGNGGFCVRTKSGRVACWSETFRRNTEPTQDGTFGELEVIEGIEDAAQLAGSERAMCARRVTGGVACWGHRDRIGSSSAERGATSVLGVKL